MSTPHSYLSFTAMKCAQVGNTTAEFNYWGRAEDQMLSRPAFEINNAKPGPDVAGMTAAAMAVGSLVFEHSDRDFSHTLRNNAETIFKK